MVGSIAYAGSVYDYVSDVDAGLMSALGQKQTCAVQNGRAFACVCAACQNSAASLAYPRSKASVAQTHKFLAANHKFLAQTTKQT